MTGIRSIGSSLTRNPPWWGLRLCGVASVVAVMALVACTPPHSGASTSGSGVETAASYVEEDALYVEEDVPWTATAQPLLLVDQGFVQAERAVDFGFTVRNPNTDVELRASDYRVVAYDGEGTALGSTTGRIVRVPPDDLWGIGGSFRVETPSPVSRLEVQVTTGDAAPGFPSPEFTVDGVTIFPSATTVRLTGLLHNPFRLGITDLFVALVLYDEEGSVIGGTGSYPGYIPGNGQVGLDISAAVNEHVAHAAFYASPTAITRRHDPADWPQGGVAPLLVDHGFGQEARSLVWAGIVKNPSDLQAVKDWQLTLTVYDAGGRVLAARRARGGWLLPGQEQGLVEGLTLPDGVQVSSVQVDMVPLTFVHSRDAADKPVFETEDVILESDPRFPKVHGRIVNPADRDLTNVKVVAVLYDEADAIVGGGMAYVEFVPAQGKAAVSVRVRGAPAGAVRTVLSATVTSLSE
jgi:hypothetical protein